MLVETVGSFLAELGLNRDPARVRDDIENYETIFRASPISDLKGGMGYNNGLICFCFISAVNPTEVLESGVWRGFTTYLIHQSTATNCRIKSFDINLSKIEYRSAKAEYFETDITAIDFSLSKQGRILGLFDDHVSHFDRLQLCRKLGVDYVIVDDDVSAATVHSDVWPPVPTANMVMNYDRIPHQFEWVCGGRFGRADLRGLDCTAIQQTFRYATAPDLFPLTGYRNSSVTSFLVRR